MNSEKSGRLLVLSSNERINKKLRNWLDAKKKGTSTFETKLDSIFSGIDEGQGPMDLVLVGSAKKDIPLVNKLINRFPNMELMCIDTPTIEEQNTPKKYFEADLTAIYEFQTILAALHMSYFKIKDLIHSMNDKNRHAQFKAKAN